MDILSVAVERGLLSPADARSVGQLVSEQGVTPAEAAVRAKLLDSRQVEMLSLLARPRDAAPGYEILDVIGHGGMGVVFRARQLNLDRVVALKVLATNHLVDATAQARFEREAAVVDRLRHPNIVAAYDFDRHNSRVYLVLEYIDGVDLEEWIRQHQALSETVAWNLARQIALGLSHAAKNGIVHRDLKPANVLLVDPPEDFDQAAGLPMVKIADFGLALLNQGGKPSARLTASNTTLGSPPYMAPEQFGSDEIDLRADLYGLGATVFHMLAGAPPFTGMTLPQIIAQKFSRPPPSLRAVRPDITPESEQLVAKLMATDPVKRLGTYAEFLARLGKLPATQNPVPRSLARATGSSTQTRVMGRNEDTKTSIAAATQVLSTTRTRSRRFPGIGDSLLALAAIVAIVGGVTGALLGWRPRSPEKPDTRGSEPPADERPADELGTTDEAEDPLTGGPRLTDPEVAPQWAPRPDLGPSPGPRGPQHGKGEASPGGPPFPKPPPGATASDFERWRRGERPIDHDGPRDYQGRQSPEPPPRGDRRGPPP